MRLGMYLNAFISFNILIELSQMIKQGSFVISHITNLMTCMHLSKDDCKNIVNIEKLKIYHHMISLASF